MKEELNDRIDKYNLGHLAGDELAQFEAEMLADSELADAVREARTVWEAGEYAHEQRLRSQIRKRFSAPPPAPVAGSFFDKNRKTIALALLLFGLGVAAFFFFKNEKNDAEPPVKNLPTPEILPEKTPAETAPPAPEIPKPSPASKPQTPIAETQKQPAFRALALANYKIPNGLSGIRGATNGENLSLAAKAFFEKNYALTINLLKNLNENDQPEALSLRAHAHFGAGNFAAAARDFSELEKGGIYLREAEWFGLLARMAADGRDKNALKTELESIRNTADHPYQKAAEAMDF